MASNPKEGVQSNNSGTWERSCVIKSDCFSSCLNKFPFTKYIFHTIHMLLYQHHFISCLGLLLVFALISFYPLFISDGDGLDEVSEFPAFYHAVTSTVYLKWLLVSVFVTVPMLSQVLLAIAKVSKSHDERQDWFGSFLLSISLMAPNLCVYLLVHDNDVVSLRFVYTQFALFAIQQVSIIFGMLASMFGHKSNNVSPENISLQVRVEHHTVNILLCFVLANVFFIASKISGMERLIGVTYFLVVLALMMLLYVTNRMIYILSKDIWKFQRFSTHHNLSDFMYAVSLLCFVIADVSVTIVAAVCDVGSSHLLKAFIYVQIALTCFLSLIPGEKSKRLAEFKHEKLETRLNLIRYVSHEMRTPLNTANMGLTLIMNELTSWKWKLRGANIDDHSHATDVLKPTDKSGAIPMSPILKTQNSSPAYEASIHRTGIGRQFNAHKSTGTVTASNSIITVHALGDLIDTAGQVNESCKVAISTLDDLLTFDKIDEQKLVIELCELNAWNFLCQAAKPFSINARQAQVDFKVRLIDNPLVDNQVIRGDQFKLSQVVRNLVSNALKFAQADGKVEVTLSKTSHTNKDYARISVKDNGAGISKENQKKLFGQYVQFKAAELQQGKGSGLGLWITKSIVEMHKGFIGVDSDGEGKGCTFYVDLPLFKRKHSTGSISSRGVVSMNTAQSIVNSIRGTASYASPNLRLDENLHSISIQDSSTRFNQSTRKISTTSSSVNFRKSSGNSQMRIEKHPPTTPVLEPMNRITEMAEMRRSELIEGSISDTPNCVLAQANSTSLDNRLTSQNVVVTNASFLDLEKNELDCDGNLQESIRHANTEIFVRELDRTRSTLDARCCDVITSSNNEAEINSVSDKRQDSVEVNVSLFNRMWRVFSTMGDRYQSDELDQHAISRHPDILAIATHSSENNSEYKNRSLPRLSSSGSISFLNNPVKFWIQQGSALLVSNSSLDIDHQDEFGMLGGDVPGNQGVISSGEHAQEFEEEDIIHVGSKNQSDNNVGLVTIIEERDENKVVAFDNKHDWGNFQDRQKLQIKNDRIVDDVDDAVDESHEPSNTIVASSKLVKLSSSRYFSSDNFKAISSKNRIIPTVRSESKDSIDCSHELPLRSFSPGSNTMPSNGMDGDNRSLLDLVEDDSSHPDSDSAHNLNLASSLSMDQLDDDQDDEMVQCELDVNFHGIPLNERCSKVDHILENSNLRFAWRDKQGEFPVSALNDTSTDIGITISKSMDESRDEEDGNPARSVRFIKRKVSSIVVNTADTSRSLLSTGVAVSLKQRARNSNVSNVELIDCVDCIPYENASGIPSKLEMNCADESSLQRSWENGMNILVVDDSLPNRKMFMRLLTSKGHFVREAVDGVQCVEIVQDTLTNPNQQEYLDIILMDDNMPRLTGTEATKRLRSIGFHGLIYGVTGDLYPETISRFIAMGANRVFGKPVKLEDLKKSVIEDLGTIYKKQIK